MHVSMHFCGGHVHRTRPSPARRFSSLPARSSSCSEPLVSVFSLPELFSSHSNPPNNFCANSCNFQALTCCLFFFLQTGVLPTFSPPVDCAPKPNCRGRVPRRPDWLAPLVASDLVTLCGDLRSSSPLARCLRVSSRVHRRATT